MHVSLGKSFVFLLCLPVSLPRRAENFSADNPVINEPKINEATSEKKSLSCRIRAKEKKANQAFLKADMVSPFLSARIS